MYSSPLDVAQQELATLTNIAQSLQFKYDNPPTVPESNRARRRQLKQLEYLWGAIEVLKDRIEYDIGD